MPYIAKHTESCKEKNRYIITRIKIDIENSKGSILDNSDPGWVSSAMCASCLAYAKWVDKK